MECLKLWLMIIATAGYSIAFLLHCVGFVATNDNLKLVARYVTVAALLAHTVLLFIRTLMVGTVPLTNLFEFGLVFVWGMVLFYLVITYKYEMGLSGMFILPLAIILMLWLFTLDMTVKPLMPALRSKWLLVHVITAVISYGCFAVSFAFSVMYLLKERLVGKNSKSRFGDALPAFELLDDLSYKAIFVGLPFLTIMLVTGAVWAEYSWGRYWNWDPKETWALVTWLVYAAYLHIRFLRGWKGKRCAYLSILGFLAVLFTFIGVSFLLPGIHSYL